jgi:uncharacterized protein with von Willebrand factor type A (vWA) domain
MKSKDADLLAEAYGKVMSENNEELESLLDQLENKAVSSARGRSEAEKENQQEINNIAQKCHTLLTRGMTKFSGKGLEPKQRQVIEQIAKLIVTI